MPTVIERHREVRRSNESEENLSSSDIEQEPEASLRPLSELADDERFSDDSLEEMLPPPPPACNKRSSIAWEVPLDGDDPLMTPGSTKVIFYQLPLFRIQEDLKSRFYFIPSASCSPPSSVCLLLCLLPFAV